MTFEKKLKKRYILKNIINKYTIIFFINKFIYTFYKNIVDYYYKYYTFKTSIKKQSFIIKNILKI